MQILGWLGELGELDELGGLIGLAGLAALAGLVALAELAGLLVMQISSCYGFWAITPTQPNHALSSFPALCVFLSCVSSSLPSASFPGI